MDCFEDFSPSKNLGLKSESDPDWDKPWIRIIGFMRNQYYN